MEEFWNEDLPTNNNIAIIATKIIHMSIIGNITFLLGCIFSINLDRMSSTKEKRDKKHILELFMEVFLFISAFYICHYFIRNILQYINTNILTKIIYWADDIKYDMKKLKSLGGGVIVAFAIFSFAKKFKSNIEYLLTERLQFQKVDKLIDSNKILEKVLNSNKIDK